MGKRAKYNKKILEAAVESAIKNEGPMDFLKGIGSGVASAGRSVRDNYRLGVANSYLQKFVDDTEKSWGKYGPKVQDQASKLSKSKAPEAQKLASQIASGIGEIEKSVQNLKQQSTMAIPQNRLRGDVDPSKLGQSKAPEESPSQSYQKTPQKPQKAPQAPSPVPKASPPPVPQKATVAPPRRLPGKESIPTPPSPGVYAPPGDHIAQAIGGNKPQQIPQMNPSVPPDPTPSLQNLIKKSGQNLLRRQMPMPPKPVKSLSNIPKKGEMSSRQKELMQKLKDRQRKDEKPKQASEPEVPPVVPEPQKEKEPVKTKRISAKAKVPPVKKVTRKVTKRKKAPQKQPEKSMPPPPAPEKRLSVRPGKPSDRLEPEKVTPKTKPAKTKTPKAKSGSDINPKKKEQIKAAVKKAVASGKVPKDKAAVARLFNKLASKYTEVD